MPTLTLLDVAKMNGNDKTVGLIEENVSFAPELSVFPVLQKKGTSYTTYKRTGLPTVGFRDANSGVTPTKSTFAKQLHQMYILAGRVEVDKAVGVAHEDGLEAYEMIEANGVAKATLMELGQQIWYGVSNEAKGFPGLKSLLPKGGDITVDATGSTANTASSLYAVKFGAQDTSLVVGNSTTLDLSDFRDESLADADGKKFAGRVADLTAWVGLQVGNANCIGRILNLTADSGKGLTDSLISQLLEKFPVGFRPDALFVSRRSLGQLQRSRTVTIMTGAGGKPNGGVENVAPVPTEAFGIPIIATDSISNTDAIE